MECHERGKVGRQQISIARRYYANSHARSKKFWRNVHYDSMQGIWCERAITGKRGEIPKTIGYDPSAKFDVKVWEMEFRRTPARTLMARIYQPRGAGPFPALLDLHGGAWNRKNLFANEPMDRAVAASGMLVVAIDMTLATEAPYPAMVQDANYGIRWLKARAGEWNGNVEHLGVLGSSSGGHVAELVGMRPGPALNGSSAR